VPPVKADLQPHITQGFRARMNAKLRMRVRAWITGHQIVHWDEGDERLHWDYPSYPVIRTMRAYPGEPGSMTIGKYSGMHYSALLIPGGEHHMDWVGTLHSHVENGELVSAAGAVFSKGPIVIGNDCYVGYEAVITSGVTLGDGAAVAARAMVTKDVEPYSIVGGNPARHIRYRFEEPVREALLRIKWWDWSTDKVAAHKDFIHSPRVDEFVDGHDPQLGDPSCEICRSWSEESQPSSS
jgi:carbonic anhydrase/acetyltransferase-like protein (isoleucine patch superfamily)